MTLIVWVGNKNALAFAADSIGSVQYGNGVKGYIVNKLFEVTERTPIWVATAWSSDFWGLLLEVIIKDFRKKLGNSRIDTLQDCVSIFIKHLKQAKYIKGYNKVEFLNFLIKKFLLRISRIRNECMGIIIQDPEVDEKDVNIVEPLLSAYIWQYLLIDNETIHSQKKIFGIPKYSEEEIDLEFNKIPVDVLEGLFCAPCSDNYQLLKKNILSIIDRDGFFPLFWEWSELIFFWFWEDDFYPKVCSINLYYKVGSEIVRSLNDDGEINGEGFIKAYAQSEDVENSILWIGEGIKSEICKKIEEKLTNNEKIGILKQEQHNAINDSINQVLDEIRENKLKELSLSARFLSKTELWQIAENFVGIGSMKKRINLGDETIWWPIDVAIVTKSDGFIRIKRKHYFDPQKNYHYFNNLSNKHEHESSKHEFCKEGCSNAKDSEQNPNASER